MKKSPNSIPSTPSLTKRRVILDFETRSACDLKKSGAFKYSLDPTTRPTCLAWRFSPKLWGFLDFNLVNRNWCDHPENFRKLWSSFIEGCLFVGHNVFFERCIYTNILVSRYGWPEIPFENYRCTAAKAAACALPRALQGAGEALNLAVQKDRRGYAAMMSTCKPTKAWTAWRRKGLPGSEPKMFLEPEDAPEIWHVLYEYCKIDVLAEVALDKAIPDLSPEEEEIWLLNQRLNWRGLRIDIPTVRKIVDIMALESKKKLKELDSLTMGLVTKPGSRNAILEFLELEGVKLPNLQKQTVEDKLSGFDLSPDMHQLLSIRKALSMTSTKKYQAFLARASKDHRVRDILMYHGASTGRDAGTGINPQNFPKGVLKTDPRRPYAYIENIVECEPELLTLLYGDSLAMLFSSVLRNMIIPSEGCELFVGDYAKIEVAVLWWLAGNEPGLRALREGRDPYRYQAAANTGRAYEDIKDPSPERDLGKAQVLGCGFGMGADRFQKTAWDMFRLKLSEEQSKQAVENYRRANSAVPVLWKEYEAAAVSAVEGHASLAGKSRLYDNFLRVTFPSGGRCRFSVCDKFLWVTLPSGRKLAYREPQITWRESEYGPRKTLEFRAVNSKTKKWALERTWGGTLTENIVQATARDLLMPAMVRLEKAGYRALLTVHDEAICERTIGEGNVKEFLRILCAIPPWAAGLPIDAKGWVDRRYRK